MNTVRPEIVTIKSSANKIRRMILGLSSGFLQRGFSFNVNTLSNIKNALPNEIDAVPNTMNVIKQITVKNKIPQKKNKTIILIYSLHTSYE